MSPKRVSGACPKRGDNLAEDSREKNCGGQEEEPEWPKPKRTQK